MPTRAAPTRPHRSPRRSPRRIWDDGTANPEPALDQFTLVSKYEALGWLLGGFAFFGLVGTAATMSHPEKRVPWVRAREGLGTAISVALAKRWTVDAVSSGSPAADEFLEFVGLLCLLARSQSVAPMPHISPAHAPLLPQAPKQVVTPPEYQ